MADKRVRQILEWQLVGTKEVFSSYDNIIAKTVQAETATRDLNARLEQVRNAYLGAGSTGVSAENKQQAEVRETITDYDRLLERVRRLDEEQARRASRAAEVTPVAPVAEDVPSDRLHQRPRLGRIGSEIRQLPSIGIPGAGFGTDQIGNILRVGGAIQEVTAVMGGLIPPMTTLAPVVIAIGAALAVTAIALKDFFKAIEDGKRSLDNALNAQKAYYEAVENLNTEQAQDRIRQLESDREAIRAQIVENQAALERTAQDMFANFGTLAPFAETIGSPLKTIQERIDSLNTQSSALDQTIARLTQGMEAGAFAINDANEAMIDFVQEGVSNLITSMGAAIKAANDFREEYGKQQVDQIERQREVAEQEDKLRAGTAEAAREFFTELTAERVRLIEARDALVATGNQSEAVQAQIQEYNQKLEDQRVLLGSLATDILPQLEAAERAAMIAAEGLERLAQIGELAEQTAGATVDYLAAVRARQDAEAEHADKLLDIAQKLNDAQVEAAYDRDRALEDATYEAEQRRNDITEEAAQARVELEEDTERKRRQIERRFNRSMLNAIGERDALAAYQAEQRRNDELADLEENYDEQEATIQRRLEEQRRTIDRNLENQQRTIQRRYEDQLRTANLAHQRALQQEAQRWTAELQLRQAAEQQALMQLNNLLNAEAAMAVQGYNTLLDLSAQYWNSAISQVAQAAQVATPTNIGSSSIGGDTGGSYVPSAYAAGGRFSAFQAMRVGENGAETVMFDRSGYVANANATNRMAQGSGGNQANITINMDGRSHRAASRREAVRYVGEILADLEIE